jgi:hypothetical protein
MPKRACASSHAPAVEREPTLKPLRCMSRFRAFPIRSSYAAFLRFGVVLDFARVFALRLTARFPLPASSMLF